MNLSNYQKLSAPLVRIGLGLIFLANAYIAFVTPDDFTKLIGESFLATLLPVSADLFVRFIGVSDGLVALLLFIGKGQKYVAAYASLWLVGVMVTIGIKEPADMIEHAGILSVALYLVRYL